MMMMMMTFLVPAHPGSPGQRAVKGCVCVARGSSDELDAEC